MADTLSGGRIRLMVIEHDVPDIPDRQVQLADGFVDLPGSRMIAHQPQGRFESEPRGEQPVHHEVVHAPGDAVAVLHQEQQSRPPSRLPSRAGDRASAVCSPRLVLASPRNRAARLMI